MTTAIARFWVFVGEGITMLSLAQGASLTVREGGETEEGYDVTVSTYTFSGDIVTCEVDRRARDCDGRLDVYSEYQCATEELFAGNVDRETGVKFPAWVRVSSSQRDYEAEKAGY